MKEIDLDRKIIECRMGIMIRLLNNVKRKFRIIYNNKLVYKMSILNSSICSSTYEYYDSVHSKYRYR